MVVTIAANIWDPAKFLNVGSNLSGYRESGILACDSQWVGQGRFKCSAEPTIEAWEMWNGRSVGWMKGSKRAQLAGGGTVASKEGGARRSVNRHCVYLFFHRPPNVKACHKIEEHITSTFNRKPHTTVLTFSVL
jgi:hypothetical protein